MTSQLSDDDLAGALRGLDPRDPLPPIDSATLITRGHRGIRRRRILAGTGSAALVAAIAVSASLLPNLNSARTPPVATSPSATATSAAVRTPSPYLAAMPGVRYGDAALGTLTNAEATRRCKVKYPTAPGALTNMLHFRAGQNAGYAVPQPHSCLTPGDSRPTAAGRSWLAAHPLPGDDAGLLLNCSLELWHDIRSWRIVAKDTASGLLTSFVAVSPSGRFAALCHASVLGNEGGSGYEIALSNPTSDDIGLTPFELLRYVGTYGSACYVYGPRCTGYLTYESNRTDREVTRLLFTSTGASHEIAVTDGWYALAWDNPAAKRAPGSHLTAFDKDGKVLYRR